MKKRMIDYFYINSNKISVFPFGINNVVPRSRMTNLEARSKVSINSRKKLLLFFGNIAPYKGLDILIDAMTSIDDCELVIAGRINNCHSYWENIEKTIENRNLKDRVIQDIEFIPDERIEIYFKAADLLILPYRRIDQSGVLFLSYSFGLPVIAADVGDLSKNIIEGITGYVFEAGSSNDLSNKINMYFESELFKNIEKNRELIIQYVVENNSWGNITKEVNLLYRRILEPS
jgi:glycosyltransferase involved in cell wall biosynthesis